MAAVGFEPTPPKRLVPKTSALDRSATLPLMTFSFYLTEKMDIWLSQIYLEEIYLENIYVRLKIDQQMHGSNCRIMCDPFNGI